MGVLDRITEGYFGQLGEKAQDDSQKRIDWICDQARGENVLDIGCSQGICELLLARKGFYVTGYDIEKKALEYAQNLIDREPAEVSERVTLCLGDFTQVPESGKKYDTVLMTEILEHLSVPEEIVERAAMHLKPGGYMVVTVPFGINDFPDHKQTFYFADIYEVLSRWVNITKVYFFGAWIGLVGRKDTPGEKITIDAALVRSEEREFYKIERALRDHLSGLNTRHRKAVADYEAMKQNFISVKSENKNILHEIQKLRVQQEKIEKECLQLQERMAAAAKAEKEIRKRHDNERLENERLCGICQDMEDKLTNANKKIELLQSQNGKLLRERDFFADQYFLLANAKLGRLTLKYWKIKDWLKAKISKFMCTPKRRGLKKKVDTAAPLLKKKEFIIKDDACLPKVSVIIPTYKKTKYLQQSVESVLKQNYPQGKIQVILSVNGRDETYYKELKEWYKDEPRVMVVYTVRAGAAAARNYATKYVTGTCIMFLDDDDYIQTEYIRTMASRMTGGVSISVGNWIDVSEETGEFISENYITRTLRNFGEGAGDDYQRINTLLSTICGKLYTVDLWKDFKQINETLKNTEDVVFWADNFERIKGLYYVCPYTENGAYVRRIVSTSLSRPTADRYFSFYIEDRLAVIECLSKSLIEAQTLAGKRFIKGKIEAQTNIMHRAYSQMDQAERKIARDLIFDSQSLFLNKSRFGEIKGIAFCHNFSPTADPSAYVATKRLNQISEWEGIIDWTVISADMGNCRKSDGIFEEFYGAYHYSQRFVVGGKAYFNEKSQMEWGKMAYAFAKGKNLNTADVIYSRSMWAGSHIAAYLYKMDYPNVKWYAEFSDPIYMDKDDTPRKPSQVFESEELNHFWGYVEKLVYTAADEIIFTNHNQCNYMLQSFPEKSVTEAISQKCKVMHHPVISRDYCQLFKAQIELDDQHIHIAYFGSFYSSRRADFLWELLKNKKVLLHLFVSDSGNVTVLDVPERTIIYPPLQYFEFLNLASRMDYLVIVDPSFPVPEKNPYLPSKLADYFAAGTPILAFINEGSPLSKLREREIINLNTEDSGEKILTLKKYTKRVETQKTS